VVTGLPTSGVTIKSVTLNGVSHTFPSDIDVVLQSPNGTYVVLMSDAGSGTDIVNVNNQFQDGAPAINKTVNQTGILRLTNVEATDVYPQPGEIIKQAPQTFPSFLADFVHKGV